MTDCRFSREVVQLAIAKDLGNIAHPPFLVKLGPIRRDYPGRLLPAVLKCIETQVSVARCLCVCVDTENPTLVAKLIGLGRENRRNQGVMTSFNSPSSELSLKL